MSMAYFLRLCSAKYASTAFGAVLKTGTTLGFSFFLLGACLFIALNH
jgi:hypothetical protein